MKGHTTTHSENLARLSRIEGQVRGVQRMISAGEYCIDIITQIQAARAALGNVERQILCKHMQDCVSAALRAGSDGDAEEKIEEVVNVLKRGFR